MFLLTASGTALAQPAGAPPTPPGYGPPSAPSGGGIERRGFLIGFSIGGGSFSAGDCDGCEPFEGLAIDLHLGGMLTPRLALMFDSSGVGHPLEGGGTIGHSIHTLAAQYWVTPRVWVKGGLGFGSIRVADENGNTLAEDESGVGAMVAAGVELVGSRTFALDLQLRGSSVEYDEGSISMGMLNLGFNWY